MASNGEQSTRDLSAEGSQDNSNERGALQVPGLSNAIPPESSPSDTSDVIPDELLNNYNYSQSFTPFLLRNALKVIQKYGERFHGQFTPLTEDISAFPRISISRTCIKLCGITSARKPATPFPQLIKN